MLGQRQRVFQAGPFRRYLLEACCFEEGRGGPLEGPSGRGRGLGRGPSASGKGLVGSLGPPLLEEGRAGAEAGAGAKVGAKAGCKVSSEVGAEVGAGAELRPHPRGESGQFGQG